MVHEHMLAMRSLGGDQSLIECNTLEAYAGGMTHEGGGIGGIIGRRELQPGLCLMGGLSFHSISLNNVTADNSILVAGAIRNVYRMADSIHPFVEAGGWYAGNTSFAFTRTYINGAGTATGVGKSNGGQGYIYGRGGLAFQMMPTDELGVSAEIGYQLLSGGSYVEPLTASNPFEAHVVDNEDRMVIGKLKAQWTHSFSDMVDFTLWGGPSTAFNKNVGLRVTVPGIGTLTPIDKRSTWGEYGVRVGFRVSNSVSIDVFANGIGGTQGVEDDIEAGGAVKVHF